MFDLRQTTRALDALGNTDPQAIIAMNYEMSASSTSAVGVQARQALYTFADLYPELNKRVISQGFSHAERTLIFASTVAADPQGFPVPRTVFEGLAGLWIAYFNHLPFDNPFTPPQRPTAAKAA